MPCGGVTKSRDGDIKCPRGVTPNPHGEWHQEPQGCHCFPAVSAVPAALSPAGVSSHCVADVPGAGTVPWTGHLLLRPNAALSPPPCTRISFLHSRPSPSAASTGPAVSHCVWRRQPRSAPGAGAGGHPPPGQPLSVLTCPRRPSGRGSFCAAPQGRRAGAGRGCPEEAHLGSCEERGIGTDDLYRVPSSSRCATSA